MIYKNELIYFKSNVKKQIHQRRRKSTLNKINSTANQYWKYFCKQTSMHGMRYLSDEELQPYEKIIWAIVVLLAIFGTFYVSVLLSKRFSSDNLATVVESTVFPVYQIPFPAITICNQNRINWNRINEAEQKFISNGSTEYVELFRRFVSRFEYFEYGNFDEFDEFKNISLKSFDHINITALVDLMSFRCEEIFEKMCWWRNGEFPCCRIFMKQRSEYGLCYAFNSVVNDEGREMKAHDPNWPWRTSTAGDWSGLRATIRLNQNTTRPGNVNPSGIIVMINQPQEWPTIGIFIPSGTATTVLLKPKVSYASQETRSVEPEIRECIFQDETKFTRYKTYPEFKYTIQNCVSVCRQEYTIRYCNCTVEIFFPPGNYTSCKASDYSCLAEYDRIFNYEKFEDEDKYINSTGEGMICSCLHECYSLDYQVQTSPFQLSQDENFTDRLFLQVHYQRNTILKYRTNLVFGWLDLLVGFGGIAGLFLGSSLISGFELFYYMTVGFGAYLKKRNQKNPNINVNNKSLFIKTSPAKIQKSEFKFEKKTRKRNLNKY